MQYIPNISQSALSFVTCVIIPFVNVAYIIKGKCTSVSFNCGLSNAKTSVLASVIGNGN